MPGRIGGTGNLAFPFEHVKRAVGVGAGLGNEAERMVSAPLFALLLESVYHEFF